MVGDLDDKTLGLLESGHGPTCRAVVEQFQDFVFNISLKILGSREDAEEAAQDTFVKAFQNIKTFHREAKFSTWLYRIAFNNAAGRIRKKKTDTRPLEGLPESSMPVDSFANAFENLHVAGQKEFLNKALAMLGEEDRGLLTLYYLNGLSMQETAEAAGMAADKAKVKVHRARKKLYAILCALMNGEERDLV